MELGEQAAIHEDISRQRAFAVAPLGACPGRERRNPPVTDRRYSPGASPTYERAYKEQNLEKRMKLVAERFFWRKRRGGGCYGSGKEPT